MNFVNAWIIPDPVVFMWGIVFGVLISFVACFAFAQVAEELA